MNIRSALALSLSLLSSTALAAGTIKPGHVLGNSTGAERTPQDTPAISVIQQSGSGAGTGVGTALGVNVGSPGAPVVNGGALGTPSSGTLTNETGLPISTGVSGLGTGVGAALANAPNTAGGMVLTPSSPGGYYFGPAGGPVIVPVYSFEAYGGATGNSGTANALALHSAQNAIGSTGGIITVGPGAFTIGAYASTGATPVITVPANARVAVRGQGSGASVFNYTGAIDGLTFSMTNGGSTFEVEGLTTTTDQTNAQSAIVATLSTGTGSTDGPSSLIKDPSIHGSDFYSGSPNTHYWASGINTTGVNNVNIIGGDCNGSNQAGALLGHQFTDCIVLQGSGVGGLLSIGAYEVAYNVKGFFAANCASAIKVNDFFQGLVVTEAGVTFCNRGIYQAAAAPSGALTQIQVNFGQFYTTNFGIDIEDPQFAGLTAAGVQFAGPSGTLIKNRGVQFNISDNNFACVVTNGTIAINLFSGFAQGGTVANNNIFGCGAGVNVPASANAIASVSGNRMVGNGYGAINVVTAGSTTATVSGWTPSQPITLGAVFEGMQKLFTGAQATTVLTVSNSSGPALAVGQSIFSTGTTETISSFGSGSGGDGTYNMSVSQTLSSQAMASNYANPPQVADYGTATPAAPNGTYILNASGTYSGAASVQWIGASPFDYVLGAGAASITIDDPNLRTFTQIPPWIAGLEGSTFKIADAATSTFNAAVTVGGGANVGLALANASGYVFH